MAQQQQNAVPLGEALQWETPTSRPKRQSFLSRWTATATATAAAAADHAPAAAAASASAHKEPLAQPASSPHRSMQQRLDAVLPPHRTYFGRSRRFLLLFVILPLLILLLVILPLAIGLGVGLSGKKSPSRDSLPLPDNGSGGGQTRYTGDLTFYSPGLGACGAVSTSEDAIASVSHVLFDAAAASGNPNENPLCGRRIRISREGKSAEVTVVDRCEGCAVADLDLSPAVFRQLAPESAGRVGGTWSWI